MFTPRYTISHQLLTNIKRINSLIIELNYRRFSHLVLVELERSAREVSAYASTSIEGNPLPLTEVKKILKTMPETIRDSEKEVINYNAALEFLDKQIASSLSIKLICDIQKQVTTGLLPTFESGRLRERPVVVNDPQTRTIAYLPPEVKDVRPLMEELIEYINKQQIGSLHGRIFRSIQGLVRLIKLIFLDFLPTFFSAFAVYLLIKKYL